MANAVGTSQREVSGLVHSNSNAAAIHAINSQLLAVLFADGQKGAPGYLRKVLGDSSAWIINTLYASNDSRSVATAPILKTSSTYHRGEIYDATSHFGNVQALDETVPLDASVSGWAFLNARPIWLSDRDLRASNPATIGRRLYRDFALVDVTTGWRQTPTAEIVFPICLRNTHASLAIGVLNLEFFSDYHDFTELPLAQCSREVVNQVFGEILDLHACFLRAAIEILCLEHVSCENKRTLAINGLARCHEFAIRELISHDSQDIKVLTGET